MQARPATIILVPKLTALMRCSKYVSSTDAGCSTNRLRKRDMKTPDLEFASLEDKSIEIENAPINFW